MPSPERSADTPYQGSRGQQGGSAGRPDRGSAGSGRPRLPTTQLSYDTPDNGRATRTVAIGPAEPGQANSPIRARWLTVFPGGARLLQRYVPRAHAGSGDWTPYDQLDNEIRAALRLARILGHDRYPEEIVELVGFDVDAVEPFLLLTAYRGEPVSQLAGSLLIDAQRAFRVSLFRSLRLLDAAGVVHRAISPHTVRWDGHQVQIVDLTAMTLAGEPRGVAGAAPWASPEQLSGQGEADPRDDVWSAGVLTSYVSTGEPVTERSQPADLLVDDPSLRRLLGDVFGPAAGRPDAATMLRRLNAGQPAVPPPAAADPGYQAGLAQFDLIRRQKHPDAPADDGELAPARGAKRPADGAKRPAAAAPAPAAAGAPHAGPSPRRPAASKDRPNAAYGPPGRPAPAAAPDAGPGAKRVVLAGLVLLAVLAAFVLFLLLRQS